MQAIPRARASLHPLYVHTVLLPRHLLPEAYPLSAVPAVDPLPQLLLPQTGALYLLYSHDRVSRQILEKTLPPPLLASSKGILSVSTRLLHTMNQERGSPLSPLLPRKQIPLSLYHAAFIGR